ncbi:alpha-1,2-fucosyltransferase [uncultured Parabacteroides sp.]|uniref:alpha-1,2-fucosyltransferase n=1 Tax=uncultured Parabacteroides sp. TaxID=512312 RepID=UPI0025F31CAF|nr:alpha-1,2-fucosyltransferase [uncultured Parabacteroides sp.]
MIIVAIFGGLGNQMFQYALARSLQIKGEDVKIDIELVNDRTCRPNFTYRDFELDNFSIKCEVATKREVLRFVPNLWANTPKLYKQLFALKRRIFNRGLYVEDIEYTYDPYLFNISNAYLMGYFQTEKYFCQNRDQILSDFTLKREMSESGKNICDRIDNFSETCAIHIRRGDYVANKEVNKKHGICSLDYYKNAIRYVEKIDENMVYFVFSDDIEWVRNCALFEGDKFVIVDNISSRPDYEDLLLISKCKHQIIANSSFSWWGAWLNVNEDKVVISPKQWLNEPSSNNLINDLIPKDWIQL